MSDRKTWMLVEERKCTRPDGDYPSYIDLGGPGRLEKITAGTDCIFSPA